MGLKSHAERVEMLKKQIVVPYSLDGEYNHDYTAFISAMRSRFFSNNDFIGVIPGGSCVKGNNTTGSDFDMIFLGANVRNQQSILHQIQEISQKRFGCPSSIPFLYTAEQLRGGMDKSDNVDILDIPTRLSLLSQPIIGRDDRIAQMRRKLQEDIGSISDTKGLVRNALYEILTIDFGGAPGDRYSPAGHFSCPWYLIDDVNQDEDEAGLSGQMPVHKRTLYKMLNRGFSRTDIDAIFDARREMWRSRIQSFMNKTGPFSNLN